MCQRFHSRLQGFRPTPRSGDGSVARGLTRCSVGESKDSVADNGVLYFSDHMSTPVSCRPDTCGGRTGSQANPATHFPPTYTLSNSKNYPNLPLSGASAQFGDSAEEQILMTVTKQDSNLFHI